MLAFVLCLIWVLWPIAAIGGGGLVFAPLVGVAALLMLPVTVLRLRPRLYMLPLVAFLSWAAASAMWSPRPFVLAEINLETLEIYVRSEVLRIGLLLFALGVLYAGAMRASERTRRIILGVALAGLIAQMGLAVILAVFQSEALLLFAPLMSDEGEGIQNLSRNAQIMALAAPALVIGLTRGRPVQAQVIATLAVIVIQGVVFAMVGVDSGLVSLAFAAAAIAVVTIWKDNGFRIIAAGLAAVILATPFAFRAIAGDIDPGGVTDSMSWRLAIWDRVVEQILSDPVRGAGVGVLRTIRETIPDGPFAGQLLVPNHSHNMVLQLWAETGAVGAGLLSAAIVMAGFRMPAPRALADGGRRAAALAGSALVFALVSFDLWNEWWWAVVGLVGCLAVLAASLPGPVRKPTPRGIVFGAPAPAGTGSAETPPEN